MTSGRPHIERDPVVPGSLRAVREAREDPALRDRLADIVADRLDPAMSALGVIFLLLLIAEGFARATPVRASFAIAGWVIWALFVGEFVLRLWIAPSRGRWLRRNAWQLIFLAVPFLRFVRLIRTLRLVRAGRLMSSAVRTTRSAGRAFQARLAWLAAVHVVVLLIGSQVLFEFAGVRPYWVAAHAVALASVSGQPFPQVEGSLARALEVIFATYAVAFFGTIAGSIGAFYLERRAEGSPQGEEAPPAARALTPDRRR